MMIVCDNREERSGIPKELVKLGQTIEYRQLEVGDYMIEGPTTRLVLERKEAGDFITSSLSEHLNNQLFQMSLNYPYTVLILEGSLTAAIIEHEKVTRQQVYANVASAILKRPGVSGPDVVSGVISVVSTDGFLDTALLLKLLHDRIQDPEKMIRLPRLDPIKWTSKDRTIAVLASLPNIGPIRAKTILSHPRLNSLRKIANSNPTTLMEVKGIGKVLAQGIIEVMNEETEVEDNEID